MCCLDGIYTLQANQPESQVNRRRKLVTSTGYCSRRSSIRAMAQAGWTPEFPGDDVLSMPEEGVSACARSVSPRSNVKGRMSRSLSKRLVPSQQPKSSNNGTSCGAPKEMIASSVTAGMSPRMVRGVPRSYGPMVRNSPRVSGVDCDILHNPTQQDYIEETCFVDSLYQAQSSDAISPAEAFASNFIVEEVEAYHTLHARASSVSPVSAKVCTSHNLGSLILSPTVPPALVIPPARLHTYNTASRPNPKNPRRLRIDRLSPAREVPRRVV